MSEQNTILDHPVGTVIGGNANGDNNGNQKPETGTPKPEGRIENIAGFTPVDPFDIGDAGTGGEQPRRRGRPPGSRNRTGGGPVPIDRTKAQTERGNSLESLKDLLLSVHLMGAELFKVKSLELKPDQADKLADAIKNVAKFYPVGLSEKQLAWANLFMVAGGIYGPPIIDAVRAEPKKTTPGPVVVPPPAQQPAPTPAQQPQRPVSLMGLAPSQVWNETPGLDSASL